MLAPSYVAPDAIPSKSLLGVIRFGETTSLAADGTLTLALPPLGDVSAEVWKATEPIARGTFEGIAWAASGDVLFGALVDDDDDVEAAARRAYAAIVRLTRERGCPYLLRAWNHVRDVNAGEGEGERYKRFCAGRHDALVDAGFRKADFPAASAVGMRDGSLAIYFLAARFPGMQLENPRQVSAYDYPKQYGAKPPSFARATIANVGYDRLVFVSGTASVVGHETKHIGDVAAQLEETLANLRRIIALEDVRLLKTYIRDSADTPRITSRIAEALPNAQTMFVTSDICRKDLLLEIEAIG
jgi:chorismate lyase/3-hydroxybenzoate synthase